MYQVLLKYLCETLELKSKNFISDSDTDDESPLPLSPPHPETPSVVESDDEIIPSTPQQTESSIDITGKNGRSKKRKQVNKTFMDDEGFLGKFYSQNYFIMQNMKERSFFKPLLDRISAPNN